MNKVLGPRNLRAILRETYEIYRKHFWRLYGIVAIVQGPIFLLIGFSAKIESPSLFILGILIPPLCIIVAFPLMAGALIQAVSEQYLRQTISIVRAYNFAWKRLGSLIRCALLAVLAMLVIMLVISMISLGLAAAISSLAGNKIGFIFPPLIVSCVAIYFVIYWAFLFEVTSLEGLGSRSALSRSSALVKGNWWRVWGIVSVLVAIASVINIILGIIPVIGKIIGSILSTPFSLIGHILLYYDLRLRKEGYGIEVLAGELSIKPDLRSTKVWENLSNEAFTLYQQGQYSEATQIVQEALKAAEEALGSDHLDVATILRNLTGLFEAQGKYADAEPFYRRLLKIKQKVLGSDHPDVAVTCENMAELYRQIGKEDEAKKLEARARKIRSK